MELTGIDYIAWWGAGLSTFLAVIKLAEVWRDRFQIDVGRKLTSDREIGNEIIIRNLGPRPIILGYWELLHVSRVWPLQKFDVFDSSGPGTIDIKIEAHSSKMFVFSDVDYFSWGDKYLKGRKIYMRLYIAGRRPLLKRVYD